MPDRIGQQIGNYRLTRLLGKGGFAEVYLGEHLYLKTYSAVKVLLASAHGKQAEEFLAEAQTLAQLTHPNIIRVREFAVIHGTPFLAMDYAPGGTLRQRHPTGTLLSLEQTVVYIKQVAAALQHAHNHNIIHRDVKPENFLFDAQRNVQLSDFGISLFSSPVEREIAGTLPYMAYEQREGQTSFASDQYSLGIVAYEWLCGVRPFEGPLAYQQASVAPPRLREKDPSLPEAVEVVVLKALAKDPQDRYPSVLQFARALEMAVQRSASRTTASDEETHTTGIDVSRRIFLSTPLSGQAQGTVSTDRFITQFKTDLEARDIIVESQTDNEPNVGAEPVPTQEEKARQAIREAQLVLLVTPSQTQPSSLVNEHLRIANLYRRHVIHVHVRATDNDAEELLPTSNEHVTVIDMHERSYKQTVDEIATCLERERKGTPIPEVVPSEQTFEPRNPYKGLHAFTQDDAGDFFGRESLIQEILQRLTLQLQPTSLGAPGKRLLPVIGPSGSGKSSLAMAGLVPQLRRGALPTSETWVYLDPMFPGQHPLDALAHTLAPHFPDKTIQQVGDILRKEGSYGLHQLATALAPTQKARVVLLIDQFEELFSSDVPEQERKSLIDLILTAVTEPRGPLLVLLTLRADFYDRPLAYPALGKLIQQHQCTVLPLELDDLRAVIERPVSLPDVWLTFESGLIDDILFEVRGQAGALPLLEFTLDQLFQRHQGHQLTLQAYQDIGGVKGALSQHAESTYAALPTDEHRRLAQALFVRLITSGTTEDRAEQEQATHLRRRAPIAEFSFADPAQNRRMQETIDAFLAARLLTTNQAAGITTLEVNHEALISEWSRLLDWIRETQKDIHLQQMLSNDVAEWERLGRPKDYLYSRSRSKEFNAWQERNIANKQEVAFLKASARKQTTARIRAVAIVLLVLLLLMPTTAFTMPLLFTSTVTNLDDNGPGSLRQVIDHAQAGSTITFGFWLRGTILLKKSLQLKKNITITGPGADMLAISLGDQNGNKKFKNISTTPNVTVSISGITFKDTKGPRSTITNQGNLTLKDCTFMNNVVNANELSQGGAISNSKNGTLTLIHSLLSGNIVKGSAANGGAIFNSRGTVKIIQSIISGNTVIASENAGKGGGIYSKKGTITLSNSSIVNNTVTGNQDGQGGGILLQDDNTTQPDTSSTQSALTLNDSTISGNTVTVTSNQKMSDGASATPSEAIGGGIASQNSTLSITNSTISYNTSIAPKGLGGGIFSSGDGSIMLSNSTVSDNTTTSREEVNSHGGGLYVGSGSTLKLTNSIIFDNTATGGLGGVGGGIDFHGAQGTISFCTVYGNNATFSGGGISIHESSSNIVMKNTIVAKNTADTGPDV